MSAGPKRRSPGYLVRGDGRELEIGFNNRYLMDALRMPRRTR